MSYRELSAPAPLRDLAECMWVREGAPQARILPDGCMDLIEIDGSVLVAGPDTAAFLSEQHGAVATGIRFRPGALPRLLGVPAAEVRDARVALASLRPEVAGEPLLPAVRRLLSNREATRETAPWQLATLTHVTERFAAGAAVTFVAHETGWSARTLQRQCEAVYGYGPATLRRILRFRHAVALLRAGRSVADTATVAGYADQAHLSRQVRDLAGVPAGQLASGA